MEEKDVLALIGQTNPTSHSLLLRMYESAKARGELDTFLMILSIEVSGWRTEQNRIDVPWMMDAGNIAELAVLRDDLKTICATNELCVLPGNSLAALALYDDIERAAEGQHPSGQFHLIPFSGKVLRPNNIEKRSAAGGGLVDIADDGALINLNSSFNITKTYYPEILRFDWSQENSERLPEESIERYADFLEAQPPFDGLAAYLNSGKTLHIADQVVGTGAGLATFLMAVAKVAERQDVKGLFSEKLRVHAFTFKDDGITTGRGICDCAGMDVPGLGEVRFATVHVYDAHNSLLFHLGHDEDNPAAIPGMGTTSLAFSRFVPKFPVHQATATGPDAAAIDKASQRRQLLITSVNAHLALAQTLGPAKPTRGFLREMRADLDS